MFGHSKLEDINGFLVLMLAIFVVVANAMVCVLVLTTKRLRTYVNGFVVSLAVSDTLTAVMTLADLYIRTNNLDKTEIEKAIRRYFISFTIISEVGNLCAVAYERYLAVIKPLKYKMRIRRLFLVIMIAIWPGSASASSVYFVRLASTEIKTKLRTLKYLAIFLFIIVPFVLMVVMYVRIFLAIRQQKRRIRDLQEAQARPTFQRQKREVKIVKMFVVVATLYIVSWIPAILHETVEEIQDFHLPEFRTSFSIQVFVFGALITSLINPFLYTFAKQDFKKEIRIIYRKTTQRISPSTIERNSRNIEMPSLRANMDSRGINKTESHSQESSGESAGNSFKP